MTVTTKSNAFGYLPDAIPPVAHWILLRIVNRSGVAVEDCSPGYETVSMVGGTCSGTACGENYRPGMITRRYADLSLVAAAIIAIFTFFKMPGKQPLKTHPRAGSENQDETT